MVISLVGEGASHVVFRRSGETVVWRLRKNLQEVAGLFGRESLEQETVFEQWIGRVRPCFLWWVS
jgi:hypothetical protein